jgi:hypothetical protein
VKIEVIARRLHDAGLAIEGQTLFLYAMPSDVKKGVLVKLPLQGIHNDFELPGFFNAQVQVIVRAQNHAEGSALAQAVIDALQIYRRTVLFDPGTTTEAMTVNWFRPITLPIRYPRSDGNGLEWSINFETCYVMATSSSQF